MLGTTTSNPAVEDPDDEEIKSCIKACFDYYRKEDEGIRNLQIAFWKKLENYFQGIQRIFWDFSTEDWRRVPFGESDVSNPTLYDKIINIYKAHGEALIAALSIKTPSVNFIPDDGDVIEDVDTAKAYSKLSDLLGRHNSEQLLFVKSLFILYNQGLICAYIYNRDSSEYGTVKVPQYGQDISHVTHDLSCPACQQPMGQIEGEYQPQQISCPTCQGDVEPNDDPTEELIPQIVGYTDEPKSRTIIDVFGPLYVSLPFYARKQKDVPYLQLRFEQHITMLRDFYGDKLGRDKLPIAGNNISAYDRWARAFNALQYSASQNLATVTCQWLRPFSFECLNDETKIQMMKEKFPKGCYAVIINDNLVAEYREEALDDHWVLSENPLSNYLHADPMGKALAPIQEITTEINDLALETFEHSIPETFADPQVLNFQKYKDSEARPGSIFPAKPGAGKGLADGFHTLKTATLNEEMKSYDDQMQSKGQFVTGSFPSIYGGPAQSGSKTAQEYTESRAMALQRLNITWMMLKDFWAKVKGRSTVMYANSLVEDEKYVQQAPQSTTGYDNIWIHLTELTGKVGRVEPNADEGLPVTSEQIRSILMELLPLNNDFINETIFNPLNSPIVSRALGVANFYIPGQDNRDKQYAEIGSILKGIPVSIDVDADDHLVHIQTLKAWLVSASGRAIQQTNPQGYAGCVQHLRDHQMIIASQDENKVKDDSAVASTRS